MIKILSIAPIILLLAAAAAAQERRTASAIIGDNTGSLREYLGFELAISGEAAKALSQRGPVCIFSFEFRAEGEKEFGSLTSGSAWFTDNRKLWEKLNAISTEPGQTQLIDAIDSARIVVASKVLNEKLDAGIIFIATDGEDRASGGKIKDLIENLKRDHIKVFVVGLVESVSEKKKARQLLKQLASETGGNAIFPKIEKRPRYELLVTELLHPAAPVK